ncbi:MAG: 1-acyl-sn-glycerol-3-phosphate acyltransferase [Planctomycetes bacterium]|nr:1-acyl-sn-glycerol-3-phosphate acyltransferase [Planctomycetota bacterium]
MADAEPSGVGWGATGGRWRGALLLLPLGLFAIVVAGLVGVPAAVSRRFRERGFRPIVRAWGRWPLRALGIRLDVHGLEHLEAPGPRLLLFNHVSLLDLFVLAALCPRRPVVLYKKEFRRIPGLGLALANMGMIPVDRRDHEAALRSVAEAGARLRANEATVMMAPEGTRSRAGGLQEFKLGAFHLAAQTGVPVVPMILRGIDEVLPMGSFVARPGVVRVDLLPPLDTRGWQSAEVRRHAREVRELFLRYLPPAPGTPVGEARA